MKRGDKVRLKVTPMIAPSCGGSVYMDENPCGTIIEIRGEYARIRWSHTNSAVYKIPIIELQCLSS
jgi:hypothetical protein